MLNNENDVIKNGQYLLAPLNLYKNESHNFIKFKMPKRLITKEITSKIGDYFFI